MSCSVLIVNYNGGPLLSDAVGAALASAECVETLVADNGSTDGSLAELRLRHSPDARLKIVEIGANIGFGAANNRLLRDAVGDWLLILNPDCIVSKRAIADAIAALQANPDAGVAGCLILNEDGTEQPGCRRRVPTPSRSLIRVLRLDRIFPDWAHSRGISRSREPLPDAVADVEAISGAFMLVRRTALAEVGVFDEGYFLHCEDLDWCMRFREKGWRILFVPHATAVHRQGVCSRRRPVFVEWHKHKGMVRFYSKFFRRRYPVALFWLVVASVWARFVLASGWRVLRQPRIAE